MATTTISDPKTLLQELAEGDITNDVDVRTKIREGCDIVSRMRQNGVTIPTSIGVKAVNACVSMISCSRVLRVLISTQDSIFLIRVGVCTSNAKTEVFVLSLARYLVFAGNDFSDTDRLLTIRCVCTTLERIVNFRCFGKSVTTDVVCALFDAMNTVVTSGNEEGLSLVEAAMKAWNGVDDDEDEENNEHDEIVERGVVTSRSAQNNEFELVAGTERTITMSTSSLNEFNVRVHSDNTRYMKVEKSSDSNRAVPCVWVCLTTIIAAVVTALIVKPWHSRTTGTETLVPVVHRNGEPTASPTRTTRDYIFNLTEIEEVP